MVRNGVNLELFRRLPLAANGKVHILGVGSLFPVKRWDRLTLAAVALKQRGLDFMIRIVGDGPLRASLERQAEDVRVGPVSPGVPCDEAGHPGRAPSILRHPSPLRDGVSYLFHSSCRDSIVLRQLALSSISLVYTGEEPVRPP